MARTQSVTIMFCDLVASTERRARLGDDAYDEFSDRLFVVLRRAVADAGGREVSNAGDGMMIVFAESVADAVSCASRMHGEAAALDADDPPRLRIGLSCGEVAQDGDQYSGMPIVEAARLEAAAAPGQTLANAVVRLLVGTRRALRFRDVGALTLKGIPEPLATVEVVDDDVLDESQQPAGAATPRRAPRRGRLVTAVAALVVVAAAAAAIAIVVEHDNGSSSASSPGLSKPNYKIAYAPASCPPEQVQSTPGLRCGTLTVPEDRSKPNNGRVVKLAVFRAPPRGEGSGDPVLDFGADSLATSPARDHAEEIQLAQRGWGGAPASVPALTCPEFAKAEANALTKPSNDPAERRRESAALRSCHDRWVQAGVDVNQYNYLAVGDDMADLVRALHLDHVNLVSGYVATVSALEVVRELPGAVRTLTLQEPVAPGESGFSNPTKSLSDAFNNYVSLCRNDDACVHSFPDLAADYNRDFEVYSRDPRVVEGDDGDGHRHAVLLDGPRVAIALQMALSRRETYPLIAAVIAAPDRAGAADAAIGGQAIGAGASLEPDYGWGANLSNLCSYDRYTIDHTGSAISRQAQPRFSGVDDGFLSWACRAWPVREIASVAFDDPSTTVPTLIVTPGLLPGADPQWADIFRRGLPNATVLSFPTLDGNLLGNSDPPCLAQLRRAFLADPAEPLADLEACERQSPKITFLASLGG